MDNIKYTSHRWTGYIWKSDAVEPQIILDEEFDIEEIKDSDNPFVVEGELYDAGNDISLSIRYVDGRHLIKAFDFRKSETGTEMTSVSFLPNNMPGVAELEFCQVWRPEEDEMCTGDNGEKMKVLRPAELVFKGFKMKEEKK